MKLAKGALSLFLAGSLALGACGQVQQAPTAPEPEPQAVQGESFVAYDGEWVDWADEVAEIAANHELCDLLTYDNLPIKGYAYPLDEVKEAHKFETTVAVPGGEASVCSDCGFVLTDVNE